MDQALWRLGRGATSSPNLATLRRYAYRPQVGEMTPAPERFAWFCCCADALS